MNHLGLVEPVDRFAQGVVIAVSLDVGRRLRIALGTRAQPPGLHLLKS